MQNKSENYTKRQKIGFAVTLPLFIILLLMPAPAGLSVEGWRVFAIAAIMAILWMTESIPIPVTALLPLILFPFFGVIAFGDVAASYANSNVILFMGGFFIAISMQKWGLHRRIALYLIWGIGTSPRRIILGFMVATAFLSMWISNTATTMMLYPIGLAVILHLMESRVGAESATDDSILNFRTALMLGIAYAASIGGIATLVGTPPNIVFVSAFSKLYPEAPEISFFTWFMVGSLLLLLFLPICWIVLTRISFRVSNKNLPGGRQVIREELNKLGPMLIQEKLVAVVFSATALAWITRKDMIIGSATLKGWSSMLGASDFLHDGTVAMLAAIVLFCIPVNLKKGKFLLDWESAVKIPWGILILFGGGIALAGGFKSSGLAEWVGTQLSLLGTVPLPIMISRTCPTMTFTTELTSNVATTSLFMPVLASTAAGIGMHPLLLMIPATISASCAFMLPVATPPNAIIFASGYVSISQMAKAGILLNLIGIVLVTLLTYFVIVPLFEISITALPAWVH